jgi:DNA replicative helicase MCM subunit Mcm2 (Cdc46/Mcm family)
MKINTYIEFTGVVKKWTDLKIQNTRLNIHCSNCGLIYYKNITNLKDTKIFNHLLTNTDRKFHNCEEAENTDLVHSTENSKLYKEFTNPILLRYILIELDGDKSVYCLFREGLFNKLILGNPIRITGVVKTKPDIVLNNMETFYEKVVDIISIELAVIQIHFSKEEISNNGIVIGSTNISLDELSKFERFSKYKGILTYYLVNVINPRIYINFDFFNVILIYFLFGKRQHFNVHIFDMNKNDNVSNCLKLVKNVFNFDYINLSSDNKANDNLVINKEKDNNFDIRLGNIFNSQGDSLLLDNMPLNPSQLIQSYIGYNIANKNNLKINFNINEGGCLSNFNPVASFLTNTKITKENNFYNIANTSYINNFDIIFYNSDRIDCQKDRKKSNQIIENQFQKKRKYTQLDYTQLHPNDKVLDNLSSQELYYLDNVNYLEYYCNIMKNDLETLRQDPFLSSLKDKAFIKNYLLFVNTYIEPKLSTTNIDKIRLLSANLFNSLHELIDSDTMTFEKIVENIKKISIIRAKMHMRESVAEEDIQEAYMFIKEILENNFVFSNQQKKENLQKTKKNKITYVMEKIRQICSSTGSSRFSRLNIKEACDFLSMNDDLERIIETLNYHGFMIKVNTQEYQLVN